MSSLIYETHTKKKAAAPLKVKGQIFGIVISIDIISTMCDLYHLFLLLLKLQNCLHPEGCVHHELNVVLYLLDLHTIIIRNNGEWDFDGCLNSPSEGLFDQSCTLAWELDKLALTVHNSILHTLLLLEFVTHFAMSCDAATVLFVLHTQVFPKAPVCKEG